MFAHDNMVEVLGSGGVSSTLKKVAKARNSVRVSSEKVKAIAKKMTGHKKMLKKALVAYKKAKAAGKPKMVKDAKRRINKWTVAWKKEAKKMKLSISALSKAQKSLSKSVRSLKTSSYKAKKASKGKSSAAKKIQKAVRKRQAKKDSDTHWIGADSSSSYRFGIPVRTFTYV